MNTCDLYKQSEHDNMFTIIPYVAYPSKSVVYLEKHSYL